MKSILEDAPTVSVNEKALLREAALAEEWNRPEEETAWSHLLRARHCLSG